VRALQMHLSNNFVQERVCTVLATLIECGDDSLAPQLGDLGAVEASVASLREHVRDTHVVHRVIVLLYKLVKQQPQNCARALRVDVVEAIAAAIRTHDADVRLACGGYSILVCLCPFDDFVPQVEPIPKTTADEGVWVGPLAEGASSSSGERLRTNDARSTSAHTSLRRTRLPASVTRHAGRQPHGAAATGGAGAVATRRCDAPGRGAGGRATASATRCRG
jgi:hypothetical protein